MCSSSPTRTTRASRARFRFRITADGEPECWDAMRNEITAVPFARKGKQVELSLTLEPNESVLLVFQPKQRALPPRREPGSAAAPQDHRRDARPRPRRSRNPRCPSAARRRWRFEGCSWIWYPEGTPRKHAPPGTRYFRKQFTIPAGADDQESHFRRHRGQQLHPLHQRQGSRPQRQQRRRLAQSGGAGRDGLPAPGLNQLAIAAVNGGDKPNPAGLIGRLTVELASGPAMTERVGKAWKTSNEKAEHWAEAGFDDSAWPSARELLPFGGGLWGMLGGQLTLSPVKADPFLGHCDLAQADLSGSRVYLELGALAPETAARVTVNGTRRRRLHRQPCPPRNQQAPEARRQHPPHRALRPGICQAGDIPEAR